MTFQTYSCAECTSESSRFPTVEELEIHIASDHLNYCPYECERCRFAKFPTEYALISHYRNDHGMREFYIRYRYTPEGKRKSNELRDKLSACLRQGGSGAPSLPSNEKMEGEPDSFPCSIGGASTSQPSQRASCAQMNSPQNNVTNSNIHVAAVQNPGASQEAISHPMQQQSEVQSIYQTENMGNVCGTDLSSLEFTSENGPCSVMDFSALISEAQQDGEVVKKPKDIVICQVCGLKVSNQRSSLVYHANTKHSKMNLYQCACCHKTWQTIAKSDVLKHVKAVHNGDESMIIDNRKALGPELRAFVAQCFPPRPSTKPRPMTHGMSPPHAGEVTIVGGSSITLPLPMSVPTDSAQQILQSFIIPKEEDCIEGRGYDYADHDMCSGGETGELDGM